MEECFLSNKTTLKKKDGCNFSAREMDVISCLINGGTAKSSSKVLGISPYTISTHIGNIRQALNCNSQDQIIKTIESSDNYIQIRERYIDLLLFSRFKEVLEKIKELGIVAKYKCVIHARIEEIDKYILLHYLESANIKVKICHDSSVSYTEDEFHIICCSAGTYLENLSANNIVVSENHNNDVINLYGKCIESNGTDAQYRSYSSLLGCISKIYSSKNVDLILDDFKEYYFKIKNKKPDTDAPQQNHIKITNKKRNKYMLFGVLSFLVTSLAIFIAVYLDETQRAILFTNVNTFMGEDVFLSRKDLVSKMDKILEKQKGVKFLVLVGQGGIGKTTLARHYVSKNTAKVKWEINAITEENTLKSFLELAIALSKSDKKKREELKYIQAIEDPEIEKRNIVSFVFSQLKEKKDWILLFDNVDNFKMIYGFILPNKDLCKEGTIIITTRNANCGNLSFVLDNSILNIEYLKKNEKEKLFCNILHEEKYKLSKDRIERINKFLDNIPPMPLDVSNAAYYIKNTNSSFKKYLEILKSPNTETDKLHSKFLSEEIEYSKTRYKMTIAVFNRLIEINPEFRELLLFICLLDSNNIPRKYLDQYKKFAVVSDFLQNLRRFFSITLNNGTFSIHKSIQEIGLAYLSDALTNDEKTTVLKKIIAIMTPYNSILWQKYKTYSYKLVGNDLNKLEIHIKSMINNLKKLHLPISDKNKYITRLLLAIGFIYAENNYSQARNYLNEALKYNGDNGYIQDYEYALALLTLGYVNISLDRHEDAKTWLNKCLKFCENLKGAEILIACGLCDLGRCYAKTNEFDKAIVFLKKGLSIVDNNHEDWAHNTVSKICFGLSHTYADHYINKTNGNKALDYAKKSFRKLKFDDKIEDIKKSVLDSEVIARWCLIKAYNRLGNHNKAQKYAEYYYYLYEKYFKDIDHILSKAVIDIEYGYTLLRNGNVSAALDILNKIIQKKQELNDNYYLFHAVVSRIEAYIRLNRLNEAYNDFQYAIRQKGSSSDNYTRLLFCISFYHAFVIKYKQKDYKLSLEYFSKFCSAAKDFCKSFLNSSEYNKLSIANAFEIIDDEAQIKRCLQNSLMIFSSIYGKEYSFVKDYVSPNLNL